MLGSEDRTITISNENGDTLLHTEMKYNPVEINFTYDKAQSNNSSSGSIDDDNIVSANLSGKSVLLYNIMNEKEDPLELTFSLKNDRDPKRSYHIYLYDTNIYIY